ncbi:phage tail tube protein [Pasteurella multocida]|uniref:phage tail tube protein n=1 Tax=Pasteurella multocida TaxID=747 RepID=UPI00292FF7EC|nr:phage tail tube protein [Pasteurella multocida]WNY73935.1 phage tail tube protein [Pasteurella multocida]HDR1911990.1 phage tail tube protein [Pasteurella multocida]HDR1913208.1 phage tail tube protein [Pasteurella multocida]
MAKEFASLGIIEVDGLEIDLTKCDVRVITGRKPVKTINRKARVKGFAKGITEYSLSLIVAVPLNTPEPDWDNVTDAKVTIEEENGQRISYRNCFTTEVGTSYSVDNEEMRDIQVVALDKVIE